MERINYDAARPTWRLIKTRRTTDDETTEQWQLTLTWFTDGKRKRKTKLFPAGEQYPESSPRRRSNAVKDFIKELDAQQDRAEAEEAARLAEEEAARLAIARAKELASAPTVKKYMDDYIDAIEAARSVRESAIYDYRNSAKRISEGLGDVLLRDLTTTMIQNWEAELVKGGRSVNTVLKYHRFLHLVCNHAVDVGDLMRNPCRSVKKPKRQPPKPNSLTAADFARLAIMLDAMEPSDTVIGAAIALYTGARQGEICAMKWKCYDARVGTIRIEKAIGKAGGKTYESDPKTEESIRVVPVTPQLAVLIEKRRREMVKQLEEIGVTLTPSEFGEYYIIGNNHGDYCHPVILSRSWKSLADALGLVGTQGRQITFHDLRHSFATRTIAAGADVKSVAAVLGHSDVSVTLNTYADADKESKRRTIALISALVSDSAAPYEIEVEAE